MNDHIERISGLEKQYVEEVLQTNFSSSAGANFMKRFEAEFSKRYLNYHSISFINGTATMHAALEAAGIGPGDEVIVPPLTMASTTFAVLQANGSPVFADVDENTFQISPEDIKKKITPNTKAVISVALYGGSPKLDEIRNICNEHNLFFLEDNAECFGATYKGVPVGCYGDAASFSFQSSKHLTSGEGGVLIIKDDQLADKVRSFQSLGYIGLGAKEAKIDKQTIQNPNYLRHKSLGFNYRMPELCAAVALAQTERMDELIEPRKVAGQRFSEISKSFPDILKEQENYDGATNSYWTWVALLNQDISWMDFKQCYLEFGGDPFYGAWALTFDEPFITNRCFYKREQFLTKNSKSNLLNPNCETASRIQKQLCQFQTNCYSHDHLNKQCFALEKTLKTLNG